MTSASYKIKFKADQVRLKDIEYKIPKKVSNFRPEDLDRPYYPTDESVASLSSMTYRSTFESLPDGWKLVTRGKNKDGYFGVAFFHEESRHLVISHRGTNDMKDAMEDFKGPVLNQYTSQMHSACTFAFLVLRQVQSNDISICVTGHSLGAWLAQITAFAIKYLTVEGDRFRDLKPKERRYHPRVVTLDSPGCYEMLWKLSNDYFPDCEKEELIRSLDITNYFIAPNKINATNHHVGRCFCFRFESSEFEGNNFFRSMFRPTVTHTMDFHNSNNFVQAFRNLNEILKVVRWPLYYMRKTMKDSVTTAWAYMDYKFTKALLATDVKYAPSETDEYTICRKYMNQLNDFRPDKDRLKKENVELPYKTEKLDERILNVSVFSEDEIRFLSNWKKLKINQIRPTKLNEFLGENGLNFSEDFLPDFEILEDEIKCEDLEALKRLVNRVKWIFVYFPEVNDIMSSQILIFEAVTE